MYAWFIWIYMCIYRWVYIYACMLYEVQWKDSARMYRNTKRRGQGQGVHIRRPDIPFTWTRSVTGLQLPRHQNNTRIFTCLSSHTHFNHTYRLDTHSAAYRQLRGEGTHTRQTALSLPIVQSSPFEPFRLCHLRQTPARPISPMRSVS